MPLFRLLILALIVGAGFYLYRRIKFAKFSRLQQKESKSTQVVKCQTCGLHIPKADAIEHNQQFFCCQEHLEDNSKN